MPSTENRERILVVDDAPDTLELLKRNLSSQGYRVHTASGVKEAIRFLEDHAVDLVITDLKMPRISGMELVRYVRESLDNTEVMMITGYATINGAVEAVKTGAEEFLGKPFLDQELFRAVKRALEKLRLRRASQLPPNEQLASRSGLIGDSEIMVEVSRIIAKAASTAATILIHGESGTGKELVARAIHYNSRRAATAFVPVNCGAIPLELFESELFGFVKGAFTGAAESRAGFFQAADGGTIFLDEIGETTPAAQVKLLRVLQDKEIFMVGATKGRKVDVRIIAATNKDLRSQVKRGLFRDDLYFRISVIHIHVPPLRDRGNDIFQLINHFKAKFAGACDQPAPHFSEKALALLRQYNWPGNVRELESLVQHLVVMAEGGLVDVPDLPAHMRFSALAEDGPPRMLAEVEIEHIRNVLASVEGNKTRGARILGIDRKTLREKLKRHDLVDPHAKP